MYTADLVKFTSGTPSSIFHILAEPSVDVETKNSESKLQEKNNTMSRSKGVNKKLGEVIKCRVTDIFQ